MKSYRLLHGIAPFLVCCLVMSATLECPELKAQTSTDIVVESVKDYGPGDQLDNSIANGDGFMQGMVFPGSRWHWRGRWTDNSVFDSDFVDPSANSLGHDQSSYSFDTPGTAVAYFTGHGILADGCSNEKCSSTTGCSRPLTGPPVLVSCRYSPIDSARCCSMVDRALVTHSTFDRFSSVVDYTGGPVRWGESPQSGGWAGAGTNGGANLVVLDISHGVLPPFWYQTFSNANAGVQMVATLMTGGGDTKNVADRGAIFATFYRVDERARVSESWVETMNSLPSSEGDACPGGGGGHGFNGCGCNIVIGMDNSRERAFGALREDWVNLANDSNDAYGNQFYAARWVCNYPLTSTTGSAWERP
jgi:hypothetical protein